MTSTISLGTATTAAAAAAPGGAAKTGAGDPDETAAPPPSLWGFADNANNSSTTTTNPNSTYTIDPVTGAKRLIATPAAAARPGVGGARPGGIPPPDNELTQLLLNTQSPVFEIRTSAEAKLNEAKELSFERYLLALASELKSEGQPDVSRQLAGLMLKNAISGKDPQLDAPLREKWLRLPQETVCVPIKECLIQTLHSPCDAASSAAAIAVAKIGRLEIPAELWPSLLPLLGSLATKQSSTETAQSIKSRKNAVMCVGYICEDIQLMSEELAKDLLSDAVKQEILKIISQSLHDSETLVVLTGARAFYHGILLAHNLMEKPEEREGICNLITGILQYQNEDVQQAGWEVALQLANEFYSDLTSYMETLGPLSWEAIRKGSPKIAIPAIELWNSFCDEEILILEGESRRPNRHFVSQASRYLLPILFECTAKQTAEESAADATEWTVSMAAGTCVGLCSQVLRDDILQPALIFIDTNFVSPEWQRREAAMLVYGSIMEGPSNTKLAELVAKSFESVCKSLTDESPAVRDTTAWAIGRIARFHLDTICNFLGTPEQAGLLHLLMDRLSDEPRVATNVCWALYETFANIREVTHAGEPCNEIPSCPSLDAHFARLADTLLQVAKRPDATEHNLRQAAFNALYMLVSQVSGTESSTLMGERLLPQVLEWLRFALASAHPASEEMSSIEESVCGCLNGIILRLGSGIQNQAGEIFPLLCKVIEVQNNGHAILPDASQTPASEEAMLALNAFIVAVGTQFKEYMPAFMNIIIPGLRNFSDVSFCQMCVESVGDLARSLGDEIQPFLGSLIDELFACLKNRSSPISLKPKIVVAIGDIATISDKAFQPYLVPFLEFLDQASTAKIEEGPVDNEEWIGYMQELRDATLQAYMGIVCGKETGADTAAISCRVVNITKFVQMIALDPSSSKSNLSNSIQILSDLIELYQGDFVKYLHEDATVEVLRNRINTLRPSDPEIRRQLSDLEQAMSKYIREGGTSVS